MQIHELKRKTKNRKKIQVGRGGKRGKTAGRGTKGQGARAGRKIRPEIRDRIKKLPKLRGYAFNTIEVKALPISISSIEKNFENGSVVDINTLIAAKLVEIYKGRNPKVKIVGDKKGNVLTKKVTVVGIPVTGAVKAAIEKAGGEVK